MSTWNHRVLAQREGDGIYFQIHEVYYDNEGKPDGFTKEGISVGGDSLESLSWVLERMKECLDKPVLSYSDFPYDAYAGFAVWGLPTAEDYYNETFTTDEK